MKFGSVCSGIEAASVAFKKCAKCSGVKLLEEFHKQPRGPMGRHSYCKPCANAEQKSSRKKNGHPESKRQWNLSSRYGITPKQYDEMMMAQAGVCAICAKPPARPVVDNCHTTNKVRGILCHGCNIKLPAVDDAAYLASALRYLGRTV